MPNRSNKYLIGALIMGVLFHGVSIFFTLETTYDALIHLCFAEHYATSWFEPWNYKWYTGFTVMGYPPLVHQSIGLLSLVGGLKFGLYTLAYIAIVLFITGVYRFALLITGNRTSAGYAAIAAVFSTSFIETLHIFGQLPSIVGISVLMHALPEIYLWLHSGRYKHLWAALSLMAVTITSHHVTPIFGMVFFIFPLIGMVVMDKAKDVKGSYQSIRFFDFLRVFKQLFGRMIGFGLSALVLIIGCILPYWINTKNNPITQVPIPHGSRDNFLEVTSSGLVFFLIPWGVLLLLFPYLWFRFFSKRYLFFGLAFVFLSILGTGGTTPIPRLMLGENAFNILTLDRFTLWGSIMALPIFGEYIHRLVEGDLRVYLQQSIGAVWHRLFGAFLVLVIAILVIFSVNLSYFKPSQPQKIEMLPIINFLNQDQHDHWRYLPLGFGDQMAWLSAQTKATTVDGNYHSARRLPELTSRAVERLENSKFRGIEGLGSLQQFLTAPEKYHLKYVFSNDKFYDPLLYFCGWQRLRQLENGIMVWEKLNVKPLPSILPKDDIPLYQKIWWGIVPVLTVVVVVMLHFKWFWFRFLKIGKAKKSIYLNYAPKHNRFSSSVWYFHCGWIFCMMIMTGYALYSFYMVNTTQLTPKNVVKAYYDALDFKEFERAFSYINPTSEKTKAQFMLEVAVSDGLLSSYAKMDAIHPEIKLQNDSIAKVTVHTFWITPLERVSKTYQHDLQKIANKWYLSPLEIDLDIPPDQLYSANVTTFFNHGKKRVTAETTPHEDILKQPELVVCASAMVYYKNKYSVVGTIQNMDHIPADVTVNTSLYDKNNNKLASYNAMQQIKHKLLPKETTNFRVNFEDIAWKGNKSVGPKTFQPEQFTDIELEQQPSIYDLQCASNVTNTDLYKQVALQELEVTANKIQGVLFNAGLQEVTIPQLLISYYNDNKELLWVDHHYLKEGIRQQRRQYFEVVLPDLNSLQRITSSDLVYVNGLANTNKARSRKLIGDFNAHSLPLIPCEGKGFSFLKVEINNYIGAPN